MRTVSQLYHLSHSLCRLEEKNMCFVVCEDSPKLKYTRDLNPESGSRIVDSKSSLHSRLIHLPCITHMLLCEHASMSHCPSKVSREAREPKNTFIEDISTNWVVNMSFFSIRVPPWEPGEEFVRKDFSERRTNKAFHGLLFRARYEILAQSFEITIT